MQTLFINQQKPLCLCSLRRVSLTAVHVLQMPLPLLKVSLYYQKVRVNVYLLGGEGSYSGLSEGAPSPYTPGSLMSNKLDALPLGVSSQSTNAQSSPSGSPSTQSRSGTRLATSSRYVSVQGGSSSTSFSHKPQGNLGQYAPLSPTKYVSAPMSSPKLFIARPQVAGLPIELFSPVGSLSQVDASSQFASRRGNDYSRLFPQSQATSSQYALGYSKPISSPQSTSSQSASVLSPHKQYASASQGSSGAQFGPLLLVLPRRNEQLLQWFCPVSSTTSQFAPGSPSPYDSLYCKCALSPQGVDRESTTVQSSRKQFTSRYGTQSGSSTPFSLQGSIAYERSPQPQGTASQLGPVSHSYPSVSSPSQGVSSQSTVQFSRKQLASTYTGISGTQAGSSPPFTPQGSTTYGGSPPQGVASSFAPGPQSSYASLSLSAPQAGPSTTVQASRKQFTSTFTGGSGTQSGSSTLLPLQGSTAYGGSPQRQDAASQLVRGWSAPYASVSLSSPQAVAGPSTVQGSRKQFTSTFTGGSGTQSGSSTLLPLQEALLMVDHLKMSQVRFTLGLPHMQVCRCPHPWCC